jgi:nucleotide-binding universal stress UspA family protein
MSIIKSILLHVDPSPRTAMRVAIARELASQHDATVTAMFAATSTAVPPQVLVEGASAFISSDTLLTQRRARAREVFEAAHPGPSVRWAEPRAPLGLPEFVREAYCHDLVVLGQHDPGDVDAQAVSADFVEDVIIDSGRPAIVVPYAGTFETVGKNALVVWKPTRESARAVAAALPLLERASRVHVAGWGSDPRDLDHLLLRHGIEAVFHREGEAPSDIGEYVLSRAAELGADLLVMGCYGHSRAREFVLGGASRTVLDSMTLPVLMAH